MSEVISLSVIPQADRTERVAGEWVGPLGTGEVWGEVP